MDYCIPILLTFLSAFLKLLAAYVVVDAGSGLYHCLTDRGWNVREQVQTFRLHHLTNERQTVDWRACYFGIPLMLLGLITLRPFIMGLGGFLCLVEVSHYYAHRRLPVPTFVAWLQRRGIIMSYSHHQQHHHGQFEQNFCVLSGWNNRWLNPLLRCIPERKTKENYG